MADFRCPLCREPLVPDAPSWRCARNHSFDVAREGYVNLLPVQQKKSLSPGDSADSLKARRRFLSAGHYQPLRDAVAALLQPLAAASLLDLGSGEGYYTEALRRVVPEVIGIDIAKPGIQLAARSHRDITWLVASAADLPLPDACVDVVSSLFSPLPVAEMTRVLRPGGHVLVVTPAPRHLWQLRERLFESVRAHEPDKFLAGFADDYELVAREQIEAALTLDNQAIQDLVQMTPYAWKATPARRAELAQCPALAVEAAFTVLLFRRHPAD